MIDTKTEKMCHRCFSFAIGCLVLLIASSCGLAIAQENKADEDLRVVYKTYGDAAKNGEYVKAAEILTTSLETHPERTATNLMMRAELYFMNGQIKEAVTDYDAINLVPDDASKNWERGLALFYAGEYEKAALHFERYREVDPANGVNAVWHFLSVAKWKGLEAARENLMAMKGEHRALPIKEIHDLCSGAGTVAQLFEAAKKGNKEAVGAAGYYANLYAGLYCDAIGEDQKATEFMASAQQLSACFPKSVLWGQVAKVHLLVRAREQEAAKAKGADGKRDK